MRNSSGSSRRRSPRVTTMLSLAATPGGYWKTGVGSVSAGPARVARVRRAAGGDTTARSPGRCASSASKRAFNRSDASCSAVSRRLASRTSPCRLRISAACASSTGPSRTNGHTFSWTAVSARLPTNKHCSCEHATGLCGHVASCASMDSSAGRAVHPCDAYLHVTGCESIIDRTWWLPSRTASTPPRRGIVMRAFDSGQRGCLASACRMHARQYVWTLPRGETGSSKTSVHIAQETVSRTWRPASLRSSSAVRRWRFVGGPSAASAMSEAFRP